MFRELMPILEGRTFMLTVSRVDDVTIRVCVIPKRIKEDAGENALCTPLTVTGTVDDLDQNFAAQLNSYTSAVVKLGSNLAEIEATHRARTNVEPEPKPGPVIKDGKPVFGTKDGSGATPGLTLFDAASEATVPPERPDVQAAAAGASPDAQER
jgi:PRTRC genetic system protein E